jgi:hypothetical protein
MLLIFHTHGISVATYVGAPATFDFSRSWVINNFTCYPQTFIEYNGLGYILNYDGIYSTDGATVTKVRGVKNCTVKGPGCVVNMDGTSLLVWGGDNFFIVYDPTRDHLIVDSFAAISAISRGAMAVGRKGTALYMYRYLQSIYAGGVRSIAYGTNDTTGSTFLATKEFNFIDAEYELRRVQLVGGFTGNQDNQADLTNQFKVNCSFKDAVGSASLMDGTKNDRLFNTWDFRARGTRFIIGVVKAASGATLVHRLRMDIEPTGVKIQ